MAVLRAENKQLRELLARAVRVASRNICTHEERHRGGVIWEICDMCGAKWADDKGGFKPNPSAIELDSIEADLAVTGGG